MHGQHSDGMSSIPIGLKRGLIEEHGAAAAQLSLNQIRNWISSRETFGGFWLGIKSDFHCTGLFHVLYLTLFMNNRVQ
jgi:hypothetical protein